MEKLTYTAQDLDVMARTIFGEARGEYGKADAGLAALIAVGNVIRNRLVNQKRYGRGIEGICQKRFQFSCWNPGDGNYGVIIKAKRHENTLFDLCYETARLVLEGYWPDVTGGANHYHATWMNPYPKWAKGVKPNKRIGRHLFYTL